MAKENNSNKIITMVLVIVISLAAITVLYISLPQNTENDTSGANNGQQGGESQTEESTILTVIYGDEQTNYTLAELENLTSYTGMGGHRKNSGIIEGQGNYTGVPVTAIVEIIAGNIKNYSIIATSNYKGEIANLTYNYSYILGNLDIYDPNNASNSTPIGIGDLNMVLAYKYEGNYLDESKDGNLKIVFLDEKGSISYASLWWKSTISIKIVEQ